MSKSKNKTIAVYGTLRKPYNNSILLNEAQELGKGKTKEKFTMYAGGIPYVAKDEQTSNIVVDVYEVNTAQLERVDRLEGHPHAYKREFTTIQMDDGKMVKAELYFYPMREENKKHFTKVESGDYHDYRESLKN